MNGIHIPMSKEKPFTEMSPEDYLSFIDAMFLKQKSRILKFAGASIIKARPFDDECMLQSSEMNRVLRKLGQGEGLPAIDVEKATDAELGAREFLCQQYLWVYAYWWNRMHALEALTVSKLGNMKTKKNIDKGGKTLKKLIRGEKKEEDLHPQFKALIKRMVNTEVEKPGSLPSASAPMPEGNQPG
jgi:hypothetical protein